MNVTMPPFRVFTITRVALLFACWLGLVVSPLGPMPGAWSAFGGSPLVDGWLRWDAGWFFSVVDHGYYVDSRQSNIPFFPLYPLASVAAGLPFRLVFDSYRSFFLGALLISHVAFAFALVGLDRLGRMSVGEAATRRALWLLALFPFAFYFAAAYSESLFLALSVWSILFARRQQWAAAAITCAAVVLVRITGLAVLAAIVGAYALEARRDGRGWRADALYLLLPVAALAGFELYFAWKFGDPRVYTHVQERGWSKVFGLAQWLRAWMWMWGTAPVADKLRVGWYLVLLPSMLTLLVLGWRRLSAPEWIFAATSVALIVVTGHRGYPGLESVGRYVSVIFPLFFVAAVELPTRGSFALVCAVGAVFQLWFLFMFSHWMPVV